MVEPGFLNSDSLIRYKFLSNAKKEHYAIVTKIKIAQLQLSHSILSTIIIKSQAPGLWGSSKPPEPSPTLVFLTAHT